MYTPEYSTDRLLAASIYQECWVEGIQRAGEEYSLRVKNEVVLYHTDQEKGLWTTRPWYHKHPNLCSAAQVQ